MSICHACGLTVIWRRENGKPKCYNEDGATIHWDTCSKRRWEQVKETGKRFTGKQERESGKRGKLLVTGYKGSVHGTKLDMIKAPMITGANYKHVPCGRERGECTQPPWEDCAQACPNKIARAACR